MTIPRLEAPLIFRQVSFSLAAFDHLKEWQRHVQRTEGCHLDNIRMLDRLILSVPLTDLRVASTELQGAPYAD